MLTNILNLKITAFGFNIYIIPIILFIIFIIIIVLIISLFLKKKTTIQETEYDIEYKKQCAITDWQRQAVPALAEKSGDLSLYRFVDLYLAENYVWYPGDFDDEDPQYLISLGKILFDEVLNNIKNNNYCILLLDTINRMNGGIELRDDGTQYPWISNKLGYGEDIEGNILSACSLALSYAKKNNIFKQEYIEETSNAINSTDFFCYKDNTFAVLIVSMACYIRDFVIDNQLDDYFLSFIRILACLIERNLYPDIIATIES